MEPIAEIDQAVSRARRRLVPFLVLMYLLAYLDRANVAYAKQALQASIGISEAAFAFAAGIFFVGYAVFELPSNLLLHRIGARVWLARIMVTWGLLAAAMAFVQGDTSFWVLRVLLGLAEAGFFPGVLLYLTYWFPARERGQILGLFYLSQPLCFILGGPVSGLLLDLDGAFGLHGWQLMFLVEGLAASLVGLWAYFYLTDRPAKAAWMPPREQAALGQVLAREEAAKRERGTVKLGAIFRNPLLLHFALCYFCLAICGYGIAFYLPAQVSALLGTKVGLYVTLVTSIPWLCAFGVSLFWPGLALRTGRRRLFAVVSLLGAGLGMIASGYVSPLLAVIALCVSVAGLISAQPIFWTFPMGYFGGFAAAGGIAIINALGNLGGFVAPNLKVAAETWLGTSQAGLWVIGGGALLAAALLALIPSRADIAASAPDSAAGDKPASSEVALA
ncbi:MFS transporter [Methylobacterium nodulans]|uniref:Major facilitator superfamily MFS_1 n=1 Tax=Methylobacterium nodulans (strain LMG 21967 / CNCM I-2342 / ORS 2060) TaxID=460265 RepID=B8INC2_METNO|nr:MFS transporter [Methylobacterium nodulans]ACL56448.1 major facilitator superfamily MFS_1 [Methylobacterium nodulans ORS 2060]